MARVNEEFLSIESAYSIPYLNHYGDGHPMGKGTDKGCGSAKISIMPNENFSGVGIKEYNGNKVHFVNGYTLYLTHVHEPYAIGEIIKNDLTTQQCYLGRVNNHIVVGDSLHTVIEGLREKISNSDDNEFDVAQAFVLAHPDYEKEYDWDEMVFWHSLTLVTCKEGRDKFSSQANKSKGSKATPKELVAFIKQSRDWTLGEKIGNLYLNNKSV